MISPTQRLLGGMAPPILAVHRMLDGLAPFAVTPAVPDGAISPMFMRPFRRRREIEETEALLLMDIL